MPSKSRLLLVLAASAAVSACATAGSGPGRVQAEAAVRPSPDANVYGLFLAGQAAIADGDSRAAAAYFARAQEAAPEEAAIRDRAFFAALIAGDLDRALQLSATVDKSNPQLQSLVQLSRGVDLMTRNRPAEAYTVLMTTPADAPSVAATALLSPWAAAAAGRWEQALATPDTKDRLFRVFSQLNQALLFERAKRYDEATTAYAAVMADRAGKGLASPFYAAFLERRGKSKEALALYDQMLSETPSDPGLIASRQRVASGGKPPPMLTIREGAAQALMAPAAILIAERQTQAALVYLHLVLELDPKREEAVVLKADLLNQAGDKGAARAAYLTIPETSSRYVNARARLAWSYQDDDKEKALEIARTTAAARPEDPDAQLVVADMLRVNARYDESVTALDKLIESAGARAEWRLFYMRGAAHERAGRWPEAERDLKRALSLRPDEPELLNYLGYAWVSRGENVRDAMAMIEKAVQQQPDNGAFIDSLGWAHYQLGDYKAAVEKLERAAELEAGDAEVNDHLGDAYWKVGRKDEARFKWRAVLSLEPEADIKARAEAKLASPLGPDVVGPSRAVARQ